MKILLIDNYDSFVLNIAHALEDTGAKVTKVMNDDDFLPSITNYDAVVIGPGPGSPSDRKYFGRCLDVLKDTDINIPILGICLGFQGIALAFGATIKKSKHPIHGKTSTLKILNNDRLLKDIAGASVMRYHSLMIDYENSNFENIDITSVVDNSPYRKDNGVEVMSIKIKDRSIYGLQFHPESFGTIESAKYFDNFINIVASRI